jgi:hypothetical protein
MKNLKKYFGNIGNTLLIAISLDSYRRTVNSDINNNETNKTLITESSKTLKESSNKANELINKLLEYINNKTNSGNSFTFKIY